MADPHDIQRLIGDLARLGIVVSINLDAATARVRLGDITSDDLPWLTARAGAARIWAPPIVGEQVLVLAPEADLAGGLIIGAVFFDANPAPAADAAPLILFDDGARLRYDPAAHRLSLECPPGSEALLAASEIHLVGAVRIEGDVAIVGSLTATADVVAAGKSLRDHVHTGVQAGGGISGKPQ